MGADIIGWRGCPLQASLGEEGFLGKLKLRAYARAIEEQVPEAHREKIELVVRVSGRPDRSLRYRDICAEAAAFAEGAPECPACPLGRGRALGCYHYLTYPIDAVSERLIFEYFAADVSTAGGVCDQIHHDVISAIGEDTPWHTGRTGDERALATLAQPLAVTWLDAAGATHSVDSAQVLAGLFISLPTRPAVVGYTRFWAELFAFIGARLHDAGITVDDEGEILRDGRRGAEAGGPELEAAREILGSRTLAEAQTMTRMLIALATTEGADDWRLIVDA
jgi:hypothetical protein